MRPKLELLAPAGDLETLKAVIRAGADAVYVGGNMFGARAYANNFGQEELLEAIRYAHIHNRGIFLAVNTLLKNQELNQKLFSYLRPYYEAGIDAVIVQDYGVFHFIKEHFVDLPIHTSTQMTVAGAGGARFLKEQGAQRIVMARELSLQEIAEIHKDVDIEIESFVHGALCYCYSGQCLLSSMIGGRSGNRGRCAQPCRLPFGVRDSKGQLLNSKNPYIISLKDLNTIEFLPELAESGVYSYKIEGRMKSAQYAAGVVSVYRHYMDCYLTEGSENYRVTAEDLQRLSDFGNRSGFTKGYYYVHNATDMLTLTSSSHSKASDEKSAAVAEEYLQTEIKEKLKGKLKLFKGQNAMMWVTDGSQEIEVTGNPVQTAKNRPMTRDNIEEKIRKTGNTPFVFEALDIQMEDDIFLPVAALNHLRQEALERLEQLRLAPFYRKLEADSQNSLRAEKTLPAPELHLRQRNDAAGRKKAELIVSTESREGLSAALEDPAVDTIYLDSFLYDHTDFPERLKEDVLRCKAAQKQVFYILPAVFRTTTERFYAAAAGRLMELPLDGFLVKSFDELAFLQEALQKQQREADNGKKQKEIRLDHNMYTYSDAAKEAFWRSGIQRDTIPLELNRKEMMHRNNQNSDFLLYGYLPLMVSAGCVKKNTTGCDRKKQVLYLQDRYEVKFPVKNNCTECYNIIYNAKPLFLFQHAAEIIKQGAAAHRIHFTIETKQEAARILAAYRSAFEKNLPIKPEDTVLDYTNGHYKRGVE